MEESEKKMNSSAERFMLHSKGSGNQMEDSLMLIGSVYGRFSFALISASC